MMAEVAESRSRLLATTSGSPALPIDHSAFSADPDLSGDNTMVLRHGNEYLSESL